MLAATLPQYRLGWPIGREALHVISVGTGSERIHLPDKLAEKIRPAVVVQTDTENRRLANTILMVNQALKTTLDLL